MASQNQGAVNVTSPGVASATTTMTTTTANGPPSTSAPSPGATVLTSAASISPAKTQTLASGAQSSQSQLHVQQQANNIEPLDKSSSNTLKVRSF